MGSELQVEEVQARMQAVIELRELTIKLMRQALVRKFPEASEPLIDEKLFDRVVRRETPTKFVATRDPRE